MAIRGPVWQREPFGTPYSDVVDYKFDSILKGSTIKTKEWNQLKDAINHERKRHKLDAITTEIAVGQDILSKVYNLFNAMSDFGGKIENVKVGQIIQKVDIEKLMDRLKEYGLECVCNCNYCTCNCNNCTCNCFYSCTCNCAYEGQDYN